MKTFILSSIFLLNALVAFGQTKEEMPLTVSYFGHLAIQPGIKLGTSFTLKDLKSDRNTKALVANPKVAVFTRPGINTNYMIGTDLGIKFHNSSKNHYSSLSIGLNYLLQSEFISFSVNLATGEKSNKIRESRHFLLPTINYEYGSRISDKLDWFTRMSVGQRIFGKTENTMMIFLELGTHIYLFKNSNS